MTGAGAAVQASPRGDVAVSVYMPTRNRVELLRRAVESVRQQTFSDFELIVVDDASTDATPQYLAQLERDDPRVRVLRSAVPSGAPHARNQAIRLARAEWVTGLDDDDEFLPERLAAALAMAQALGTAGICFSGLYTQDEVLSARGRHVTQKPDRTSLAALFGQNCMGNQVFARRSHLLDIGLYDEALPAWQDLDLAMRLVDRFGPARLIDAPLYRLYDDERPDRISRKRKQTIVDAWRIVCAKWPDLAPAHRQRLYLQVLSRHYGFDLQASDLQAYFAHGLSPRSALRLYRALRARSRRRPIGASTAL